VFHARPLRFLPPISKPLFQHTAIVADPKNLIDAKPIVGSKAPAPLVYKGTSLLLDPTNPLVLPILRASSAAYSYDPSKPVTDVSFRILISIHIVQLLGVYHPPFGYQLTFSSHTPSGETRF